MSSEAVHSSGIGKHWRMASKQIMVIIAITMLAFTSHASFFKACEWQGNEMAWN